MPLSEEELRLLEQMERELAAEDPKFVAALRGRRFHSSTRMRMIVAGVAFVAGVALLMFGAVLELIWLGIVGFLVMLGSAMIGLTAWQGHHGTAAPSENDALFDFDDSPHNFRLVEGGRSARSHGSRPRRQRKQHQGTFMQRLEQRWQRRRDQGL